MISILPLFMSGTKRKRRQLKVKGQCEVCVCVCMHAFICVWVCVLHSTCVEDKGSFRGQLLLFTSSETDVVPLYMPGQPARELPQSPVSASHLTVGVLGLQTRATTTSADSGDSDLDAHDYMAGSYLLTHLPRPWRTV